MNKTQTNTQTVLFFSACRSLLIGGLLLMLMTPLAAHEVRPAIIDVQLHDTNTYQLQIRLNLEALLAGIGTEHTDTDDSAQASEYNRLRELPATELQQLGQQFSAQLLKDSAPEFNGEKQLAKLESIKVPEVGDTRLARDSLITLNGSYPAAAKSLQWSWPTHYGTHVLRVNTAQQEDLYSAYLTAGQPSEIITLDNNTKTMSVARRNPWFVFQEYVVIGYQHILPKGLDHILFVVGLFLLSASVSALLWQVTSFTLAHSVTLALGMLGWMQVSPIIVEPLIAASIIYVCLENVYSDRLSRWRPALIFGFGLITRTGFCQCID